MFVNMIFLGHLTDDLVNFCHHLTSVIIHYRLVNILLFSSSLLNTMGQLKPH